MVMISLSTSPGCGPRFLAGWASSLSSRASQCGRNAWQKSSNWQKSSTSRSNIDASPHLMAPTEKEEFKGDKGLASPQTRNSGYLDFDMSEADYLAYQAAHHGKGQPEDVTIDLNGDGQFDRHGTLDFIDNAVNRSSGTIHARATVPNPDLSITPGQFARLRVPTADAALVLLVPPTAIVPDQAREMVMTVAADGSVVPKPVETGGLYQELRIIRSG